MIIGIDTSNNLKYSCLIFGSERELNKVYNIIQKQVAKNCKWEAPIHWRKMSKRTRKCVLANSIKPLEETNLQIFIFEHIKPKNKNKKEYYFKKVPNEIAFNLERLLRKTFGHLTIECDKDFEIKQGKNNSTNLFVKELIKNISYRLTAEKIPIIKHNEVYYSDIKKEKNLRISAYVTKATESKAIQLADLTLGIHNFDKKRLKTIYFKKF